MTLHKTLRLKSAPLFRVGLRYLHPYYKFNI